MTKSPSAPGKINMSHLVVNGTHTPPCVIAMFAQYAPGKCGAWKKQYPAPKGLEDTSDNRLKWFKSCLCEIEVQGVKRVAMPFKIGCGLAGGDWKEYERVLKETDLEVVLYRK
jgi:hypothetical protein